MIGDTLLLLFLLAGYGGVAVFGARAVLQQRLVERARAKVGHRRYRH